MTIDQDKLNATMFRMIGDVAAAASGALVVLGERLGLFRGLAAHGPIDSEGLAKRLDLHERYVREWLNAMVSGQYVEYDASSRRYFMSPEQKACLAEPDGVAYLPGGYSGVMALYLDEPKVEEAFRSGNGIAWGDHSNCLFCGAEKFFGPGYRANLVDHWLPALEGVVPRLSAGATVADVGCGHALSTRLMARAFPKSQFHGIDYHGPSISHATEMAANWQLDNTHFRIGGATDFEGEYDLITFFDCLHDMGDPVGIARHVRSRLKPGGTWMIVEPMAADSVDGNINPVSRAFYAFSTMICVPVSLSQTGRLGLGAQAGPAKLTEVLNAGGFSKVRVAATTPANLILEARV